MKRLSVQLISFTLLTSLIWLSGCEKGAWDKQERMQIANYIKSLGDTIYDLKPSGLYVIELSPGTGAVPENGDTVTFRAKGCLLDNTNFNIQLR